MFPAATDSATGKNARGCVGSSKWKTVRSVSLRSPDITPAVAPDGLPFRSFAVVQSPARSTLGYAHHAAFLAACVLVLILVFSEPAKAQNSSSAPGKTLIAGCEIDYPPFCSRDGSGQATGFSVDLLRAAMHTMETDVTFHLGQWADLMEQLDQGQIMALPLVGRTPEREGKFDFFLSLYVAARRHRVAAGYTGNFHAGRPARQRGRCNERR